jgi:hypothetical protein
LANNKQDQYTTLTEAQGIAADINEHASEIGSSVLPYNEALVFEVPPGPQPSDGHESVSGIFIPLYGGPFETPSADDSMFYHLRFANWKVMNAGLVQQTMADYPTNWPAMLAAEVKA